MPEPKDVKVTDPSSADPSSNPSSVGKQIVTDGRTLEQVMAENKRKAEEISELKSKQEEMEERLSELSELSHLSAQQKNEKAQLETNVELLAEQIAGAKEAQPWLKASEKRAMQLMFNQQIIDANDFLEDKAVELKLKDSDELARLIAPFARNYTDKTPIRRNQLALRDYMKNHEKLTDIEKRERALAEKEQEQQSFAEGKGRMVRNQDLQQKLDSAKTSDDKLGVALGLIGEKAGT